jgi:hypothetical protein
MYFENTCLYTKVFCSNLCHISFFTSPHSDGKASNRTNLRTLYLQGFADYILINY